jgi:hypothetical protein
MDPFELVAVGDPDELLTRLYGPNHRAHVYEAIRAEALVGRRWVARGRLQALRAADFLGPMLVDRLAHDGRSRRQSRTSGWWVRRDGAWHPSTAHTAAAECLKVCDELLVLAQARRDTARREHTRATRSGGRNTETTYAEMDGSERMVAALDTLTNRAASGPEGFGGVLATIRGDDRLSLPEDALRDSLRSWLASTASRLGWPPGRRVEAARVWRAYAEDTPPEVRLPKRVLYERIDAFLGDRVDDAWRLPIGLSEAV